MHRGPAMSYGEIANHFYTHSIQHLYYHFLECVYYQYNPFSIFIALI